MKTTSSGIAKFRGSMSNGNLEAEFQDGIRKAAIVVFIIVALGIGAWLLWHPKSPLKPYHEFHLLFQEVGTLREDSPVQILGVPKGKVRSIELRDDGVLVNILVERKVQISNDSKFRIVNAGLLGQREVEIRLGTSTEYLDTQDTLFGSFDLGSTRLAFLANTLWQSTDSLLKISLDTWDSTLGNPVLQGRAQRVVSNIKGDLQQLQASTKQWKLQLEGIGNQLSQMSQQIQASKSLVNERVKTSKTAWSSVSSQLDELDSKVTSSHLKISQIVKQLDAQNTSGSAGLLLHNQGLHLQAQRTLQELKQTFHNIQAKGLDLNADLF